MEVPMQNSVSRVEARIRQIQGLLGEPPVSNEGFRRALAAEKAALGRATSVAFSAPSDLQPLLAEASGRTGVSEDLIAAVIATESGYRPDAVSSAGALGLMQLMPGTARALGVVDPFDPRQNVLAGAEYLRRQLHHFGSVEKALAAYNAGPGAVERYGGVPPYRETRSYVRRVLDALRQRVLQHE
jgi:soluble lytic murein transglycosylase-like protein